MLIQVFKFYLSRESFLTTETWKMSGTKGLTKTLYRIMFCDDPPHTHARTHALSNLVVFIWSSDTESKPFLMPALRSPLWNASNNQWKILFSSSLHLLFSTCTILRHLMSQDVCFLRNPAKYKHTTLQISDCLPPKAASLLSSLSATELESLFS